MINNNKVHTLLPDAVLFGLDAIHKERNAGLHSVGTRTALIREILTEYVAAHAPAKVAPAKIVRVRTRPAAK